jgi:DNA repair exonuclease SbcCD ATPase subunit
MRKIITAVLVTAVLVFTYLLVNTSHEGHNLFEAISNNVQGMGTYLALDIAALAALAGFSFREVRLVTEKQRIEQLRVTLQNADKLLEGVEARHGDLSGARRSLEALSARIDRLLDPQSGLSATTSAVDDLRISLAQKLRGDVGNVSAQADAAFSTTRRMLAESDERLSSLDRLLAGLPAITVQANKLKTRYDGLIGNDVLGKLERVRKIAEVFEADSFEEELAKIEGGSDEASGDLEDQIGELGEQLDEAEGRIDEVEGKVDGLEEVKVRVEKLKERFDVLVSQKRIEQLEGIQSAVATLLDEDGGEGSLTAIENGSEDAEGDLADQLSDLEGKLDTVEERLNALQESDKQIEELRKRFVQITATFVRATGARSGQVHAAG